WYCAHIIMHVKPKITTVGKLVVWENIVLVEADSPDQALEKAEKWGREDEEHCSDGLTLNKKPAEMVFAGIRKLIEVRTIGDIDDKPADGSELTYSEFLLDSEDDLRKLAAGESV